MKKSYIVFISILFFAFKGQSQVEEFNTADLRKVASNIGFVGSKNLKGLSKGELLKFYNEIESDKAVMKQININSWAVCDYENIDNYDIYNYHYKDISREKFDQYCKEINALMLLDGTINQLK